MQLPSNLTTLPGLSFIKSKGFQQKASFTLLLLLLVYIAYVMAKITWFIVPNTQHSVSVTNSEQVKASDQGTKKYDISTLQKLNLFGLYNKKEEAVEVVEVNNAPETRLNLTLAGLVASDSAEHSAAIIEHKGKQATYGIGELIEGTRASLSQVLMDRVIIKHSGRLETLMLDGFDYKEPARALTSNQPKPASVEESVIDNRSNANLAATAQMVRNEISQDPTKIADYLKIQPKRQEGKIIGYSLRAGKSADFFEQSGLKAGDVAIQMNGYDLSAPKEAMQALNEMKQASEVSLLIERNGNTMEVIFSLN